MDCSLAVHSRQYFKDSSFKLKFLIRVVLVILVYPIVSSFFLNFMLYSFYFLQFGICNIFIYFVLSCF